MIEENPHTDKERPLRTQDSGGHSAEPSPARTGQADRISPAERKPRTGHASRQDRSSMHFGTHGQSKPATQKKLPIRRIIAIAAAVVVAVLAIRLASAALPIDITINGEPFTLRGAKTVQTAAKESGLPLNPGDLISLHGNVLQKGEGQPLTATVNGEPVPDLDTRLHNGDHVELSDGDDIVEPYHELIQVTPYNAEVRGVGVFHIFETIGHEGVLSIRTGKQSGETVSKRIISSEDLICTHYNPDVGDKKLIALTFDDGPSTTYTPQILDVLAENNAHATFFMLGSSIRQDGNATIVKRAYDQRNQICTHTYDNAFMAGGNDISLLDAEGQISQIEDGRDAITDAVGEEASRIVRVPEGNMDQDAMKNLRRFIDVEVGWNTDTADTLGIDAQAIADTILEATPGDVLLLHDGGSDDLSATVEALRIALPQMRKDGWSFVTIDELLTYPRLHM